MSAPLAIALDGCRIDRVLAASVEIVEAAPRDRHFPDRLTESLGVCLKSGPDHDVRADGRSLRYPRDMVCVRPPGCVWATPGTGPVGFLSLDIEAEALPEAGVSGRMSFAHADELPDLRRLAARLRRPGEPLAKESVVAELVAVLLERGLLASGDLGTAPSPRSLRRARELLLARLDAPPTLRELARAVGGNRFALLRAFRRAYGVPPHAFVLRARVERSRALLARGGDMAEVAHALGFADQSHFSRLFKRIVGLTPGAYRRHTRAVVPRL